MQYSLAVLLAAASVASAAPATGATAGRPLGNTQTQGQQTQGQQTQGQSTTGNGQQQGQGTTGNTATQVASAPGNAVSATNVQPGVNPFMALAGNQAQNFPQLTAAQKTGLQNAAVLWSQDTAVVSSALSLLGSAKMSDQDFRDVADMAYMAEVNELMQKNYIDALLGTMPQLQAASTSLGNGSFAIVVDQLREMRIRGPANQTFVQAAVAGMNNLRCRQVLLAIDTYVLTANQAAGNNTFISATRPPACKQVYAQTADTLPAGSVTNATTFPNAAQLITQFNQAPRFMVSNAIAFSQTSGSDVTPALGSQYTTQSPFTNTSSLAGQLLAFQGTPVMTNGAASNTLANPLNAVLFANQVGSGNGQTNGQTTGNTQTQGQTTGNTQGQTTGNTQGQTTGNTQTQGQTAGANKGASAGGANAQAARPAGASAARPATGKQN